MKRKYLLIPLLLILAMTLVFPVIGSAEEIPAENTETAEETEAEEGNVFAVLFDKIEGSFGDILSGIAAAASILIVFTYKKGLLPLLSGALERLSGTVKTAEEDAKEQTDAAKKIADGLLSRLERAEQMLEKLSSLLAEYAEKLPALEAQKGETAAFRTVLIGQVELLEEVFMASSLPQYRKDEIGERVAAIKAAVRTEEKQDGEPQD